MTVLFLFTLILVSYSAWAAGVTPISWDGFLQLMPVVVVALLGGLVSFISKVRSGDTRIWNFSEFFGDMFTSSIAGIFFYWICRGLELNEWFTAAIIGMAGHAGSRGIFMLEKTVEAKWKTTLKKWGSK
jgi:hypothetical protein